MTIDGASPTHWRAAVVGVAIALALPSSLFSQQVPDTSFVPPIERPEFARARGPRVVIDAAHFNFHTAQTGYRAFANLLRADGYQVDSNDHPLTAEVLAGIDILVIANAMHEQSRDAFAALPNQSAFSEAEITAVDSWVRSGGSLLLIADHMPLAGHAEALAAVFGLRFYNGFAMRQGPSGGRATFRRSDGTLPASTIANGRTPAENIDSVVTFTGQAFRLDPGIRAEPLLIFPAAYQVLLPAVAWEFSEKTPRVSAAKLLQGAAVQHGEGKVVALGEAAMFGAQLAGPQRIRVGMNAPDAPQNYRFALNVMHWLGGNAENEQQNPIGNR